MSPLSRNKSADSAATEGSSSGNNRPALANASSAESIFFNSLFVLAIPSQATPNSRFSFNAFSNADIATDSNVTSVSPVPSLVLSAYAKCNRPSTT